jgi:DNA-binding MarR family transcriptional regulator
MTYQLYVCCTIRLVKKRDELLGRLDELGPAIRRRIGESERHESLLRRFGGVTLHQLGALRHLVKRGPLTMHELATLMDISPSSATQLVDRLVQHGLVDRVADPADRRVHRLAVAGAAAEAVRGFEKDRSRRMAKLLAPLSEEELEVVVSIAQRLAGAELPEDASPAVGPATRQSADEGLHR